MRKKLISNTYLKGIDKYRLEIFYDNKEYFFSIKRIIDTKNPFILSNGYCLIDNGYYIVEVIPKNENYAMRIFFDKNKKRLEYYFDISLKNGIDEESKIPYYDDLYLDITIDDKGNVVVLDENELREALENKQISKENYNLANETKDRLLDSIKNNTNKFIKLDWESYL